MRRSFKLQKLSWGSMSKKTSDRLFIFFMLLFPIAQFLVFWVYLNFDSIRLSFQHPVTGEWGFSNFERFFRTFATDWQMDTGIKTCIENTLITASIAMFIAMPSTVFVTYLLFKQFYGHMFLRIAYYIPAITGTAVSMVLAKHTSSAYGPLVVWGKAIGINWSEEVLQSGLYHNWSTARITFHVTDMLGVSGSQILLLTGALIKIPRDLFEVGKLEGLGMCREFLYLVVPCSWSTIGIMWVMTFGNVWGSYSRVMMLTEGAYGTNNFAYYLFGSSLSAIQSAGTGENTYNYPAAVGLLLTVVVGPLTLFLRWLANKIIEPVEF